MHSYQVIINDSLINYYDNKKKSNNTLIFLHGWRLDGTIFTPLYKYFNEDYRIISIDAPGFGKSEIPGHALNIFRYAKFVKEFMEKINIKKAHFITHSFGGMIGIELSANYPKYVESLILMSNSGIRLKSFRVKMFRVLAKIGRYIGLKRFKKFFYKTLIKDSDAINATNLSLEMQQTYRNIIDEDIQDRAIKIKCPVLILWGEDDTETPLWHGKKWHELIKKSKFYSIKGSHFFFLENIDWIYEKIKEFLK